MKTLVFTLLLAVAACGQSGPQGYSQATEFAFVQSCQQGARSAAGANAPQETLTAYCTCVWGRIRSEMPVSEFNAYERMPAAQRASSETQRKLSEYAQSCQPKTP